MGRRCPTSGVHWNEDAAWKLACEGPSRIRELLLGAKDDGRGESLGCVVPFDRTTLPTGTEDDDDRANDEKKGSNGDGDDEALMPSATDDVLAAAGRYRLDDLPDGDRNWNRVSSELQREFLQRSAGVLWQTPRLAFRPLCGPCEL